MKALFLSMMLMIASSLTSTVNAQNAQTGKQILTRIGIEAIKMAWKGTKYTPTGAAIAEFLRSTAVVDDATEMEQLRSIQELEAKIKAKGHNVNSFYGNLDSYLKKNSSSLCDDAIYKNFYKCS